MSEPLYRLIWWYFVLWCVLIAPFVVFAAAFSGFEVDWGPDGALFWLVLPGLVLMPAYIVARWKLRRGGQRP